MKKFLTAFNVLSRLVGVMVITLTVSISPVHAQEEEPQQETAGLFSPAEPPSDETVQAAADDPSVLRYRFVNVDLAQLNPVLDPETADTPVTFNLFPNAIFEVIFTQTESTVSGGITLTGGISGSENSFVTLAIIGDVMAGRVHTPSGVYDIRYSSDRVYVIEQVQNSHHPGEAPEPVTPLPATEEIQALVGDDTGEQIDIMVVYTTNARIAAGGTSAMESLIALAVADTNVAYSNSGLRQHMVLVHTEEISGYSELSDWDVMLDELTFTVDDGSEYAALDYVQTLRDTYAADMVSMVINDSLDQYCGIGWVMNRNFYPIGPYVFDDYPFSMVDYRCLTDQTLAHETGHNLGAVHDRLSYNFVIDDSNYPGLYNSSFGYKIFNGEECLYYTVMAYNYWISDGTVYYCNEDIPYYSNPLISYNDYRTGVTHGQPNSADVHRALSVTAEIAAQWRDGPPPNPPANLIVTDPGSTVAHLSWSAPENSYVIEYIVERRTEDFSWSRVGSTGAQNLGFSAGNITCGHTYYFRVYARNGDGTSIASTEASVVACLAAPTNFSAIASGTSLSVDLSWTDNTNYETGYRIIRRYPVNLTAVHIGPLSANVTNYTDTTGLLCASTYEYLVYAFNSYSESNFSNTITVTTLICPSLSPISFSGIGSTQSRIDLSWTDPSDASKNQEAGFRIERQTGGGSFVSVTTLPGETESFNDSGLACGTSYTYRIQTYNAGGTSAWVTTTASTQPCGPAAPPTELFAQPLSQHDIQIAWTDADDETSYSIERSSDGITWIVVGTITADTTVFIDSQLEANTQYYYRVRSANSYSAEPYQYTEPASATTYTLGLYVPIVQTP